MYASLAIFLASSGVRPEAASGAGVAGAAAGVGDGGASFSGLLQAPAKTIRTAANKIQRLSPLPAERNFISYSSFVLNLRPSPKHLPTVHRVTFVKRFGKIFVLQRRAPGHGVIFGESRGPEPRNRGRRLTPRASANKRACSRPTPGEVSFCLFRNCNQYNRSPADGGLRFSVICRRG